MQQTYPTVSHDEQFNQNLQAFEHFLVCENNHSSPINFAELLQENNDVPVNTTRFQSTVVDPELIEHPIDGPLFHPLILENEMHEGFQTDETNIGDDNVNTSTNGMKEFGNPIQVSSWPLQVPPYTCSCCHILREIMHTNGVAITKLEVHGRLGLICHGVLEKYNIALATNQGHEYKMFDFCKEMTSRVKQFLLEYCKERKTKGYVMLQDPLSSFYEAVCVGLDWEETMHTDDFIPDNSGDHQTNSNKTAYSIQRERTGKLTMKDLVDYFDMPIEVAAKKIHVCPTVIKKICRKHGLSRWPYRKIRSIERKISTRAECLTSLSDEERVHAQAEIDSLRQDITNIYVGINV